MHRFFVAPTDIKNDQAVLSAGQAKHAYKVLRLKKNDPVLVLDGNGSQYKGVFKQLDSKQGLLEITEKSHVKRQKPEITLAAAVPKQSRFESMIDKATQLGVDFVVPLDTERTIVKSRQDKVKRWQKIAVEAAKQCGCLYVPQIGPVHSFEQVISNADKFDLTLIAALDDQAVPLKKVLSEKIPENCLILIGPEGDFSLKEIELARKNKAVVVSLGQNVLRCETASTMILSVINYEWKK